MKNRNKRMRRLGRAAIEALESRVVLDGTVTSVVVGDILFTAVASDLPTGGTDLFRSDLDGSDQVLLGHWFSNGEYGPKSLYGFHDTLYFAATKQDSWSRTFLWKSDGTPQGTVPVPGNYLLQFGSYPHDFMTVNDRLVYLAQDNGHRDQIFGTNGSSYFQLINPPSVFGVNGYLHGFANLIIRNDRLYAEISNDINYSSSLRQTERWVTDGTRAGTHIADPSGILYDDGTLRVFAGNGPDNISVAVRGQSYDLRINDAVQVFAKTDVRAIAIHGMDGNDTIILDPEIAVPATLIGDSGDDRLAGARGNDRFEGGNGVDTLEGGPGFDTLIGGAESDVFAQDRYDVIFELGEYRRPIGIRTPTRLQTILLVL